LAQALHSRRGSLSKQSMAPHVIVVSLEIKPEHVEEFKKAAAIDAVGSRTEPQCYRFDVIQDKSDPNKFVFYEAYENDGDAITFHRATPHFKAWSDFKAKYGVVSQTVVKADGIDFTYPPSWSAAKTEDAFTRGLMIGSAITAAAAAYFFFRK